jgi:hypothetical protein
MEWSKADWFVLGLFIGYAWFPAWGLAKKIVSEARKANDEWHNSKR